MRYIVVLLSMLFPLASAAQMAGVEMQGARINVHDPPNLLLFILDDYNREEMPDIYPDEGDVTYPSTPNIDAIADAGVVFEVMYGENVCGPTRADTLTGRYAFRHEVFGGPGQNFSRHEWTLPKALERASPGVYSVYQVFGKIGLSDQSGGLDDFYNSAGVYGFTRWWGGIGPAIAAYDSWEYTKLDATGTRESSISYTIDDPHATYAPTQNTTDSIASIAAASEPWFNITSYNCAHTPIHTPPGGSCNPEDNAGEDCYKEMGANCDAQIGIVMASLTPQQRSRTLVMVLSDNGGLYGSGGKFSMLESGIRLGFVMGHGPVVNVGRREDGLHFVGDIFATVMDYANAAGQYPTLEINDPDDARFGGGTLIIDGISLRDVIEDAASPSEHDYLWSGTTTDRCVRDAGHKYCLDSTGGTDQLYVIEALGADEVADLCLDDCDGNLAPGANRNKYLELLAWMLALEATEPSS